MKKICRLCHTRYDDEEYDECPRCDGTGLEEDYEDESSLVGDILGLAIGAAISSAIGGSGTDSSSHEFDGDGFSGGDFTGGGSDGGW